MTELKLLVTQLVKSLSAVWENWVQSLGWEDPLEKGTAAHSRILAWRISRTIQSMGFSRPEHWSGQPFPSPGDLPSPGIEPRSPALQADSSPAKPQEKSKNTAVGSLSLLQWIRIRIPNPGIRPETPVWQEDSLPAELSGKPSIS